MSLNAAPIQEPALGAGGVFGAIWVRWFDAVRRAASTADVYKVAQLPTKANAGDLAFVSNESGGAVLAFFDGTVWRRCTDRAIVT